MSLTNRILPGDALDGTKVRANFVDLETLAEAVRNSSVDPANIDTRHLSGTWTDTQSTTGVGPTALGAAFALVLSRTATTVAALLFEIEAFLSLDATGVPWEVDVEVRVDGAAIFTGTLSGGTLTEEQHCTLHLAHVATASSHVVTLYTRINAGTGNWIDAALATMAPKR